MSSEGLQRLVGTAVISKRFLHHLLEDPASAVADFKLSPEEYDMIIKMRANSFDQLVHQIDLSITERAAERRRQLQPGGRANTDSLRLPEPEWATPYGRD